MPITPANSATELCTGGSGGGGGAGTVTSITDNWVAVPQVRVNGLTSDTITTSGTFAHTWVNQGPYTVFASPADGSVGQPLFRGLVAADIPDLGSLYWKLLGNAGTTAGTNFVGTTDAQGLVFKTSSVEAARILAPVGGRGGYVGIGTASPASRLTVSKDNNYAVSSASDLWATNFSSVFNKWQTSSYPYKGHQYYTGWYADPAGYSTPPDANYGSGVDASFDICTQGKPATAGQYFEYAGLAINMNYTAKSGGDATQTSDGQSGGYVYDGHLNKPAYVVVPSSGALQAQAAGNTKLAELGMHNAVSPTSGIVATGLQMNLSDKPVAGQPVSGVYDYVRCVPGSPTVTGVGTLPPDRSTIRLNGIPYVVLSSVGTTVTLTANYSGGMTSVAGIESVHYVYEVGSIVTATNGSATVTWVSGLTFDSSWKGYQVLLGGAVYIISSVTNSTTLVLTTTFSGTTGTTNANFYSIYVAQQDLAIHVQTHSDARNWNAILQHNHGFSTPCNDQDNVRTMISGDGGLFNRFAYISPYKTSWSPGANWGSTSPLNVGSALYITEEFTAEMAGALATMYSPVKATQPFFYARQDVSTYSGNAFELDLATDGQTPASASGSFTGNFIMCRKDFTTGVAGSGQKFWVTANGTTNSRFLDIGPRQDGYVADPANIVSISDHNYLAGTGNNVVNLTERDGTHGIYYARQNIGAFGGAFYSGQSRTDSGGSAGSGTFTGKYLSFQHNGTTDKFYVDYQSWVFIGNTTSAPPSTPTGGGILYVDAGALKYIGSGGTVTPIAPA